MSKHEPDDAEVQRDIADTEDEIALMKQELVAFEAMPAKSGEYRMTQLKIANRRFGIKEREQFIAKLHLLLAARKFGISSTDKGTPV